jgi:glycosyltransferase involved in cell wall biosynthesis
MTMPEPQKMFFDATLMLPYGFLSPVGIVRVEHYVAEYLARDPAVKLDFVIYDRNHNSYRAVITQERETLEQILFRRYKPPAADVPGKPEIDGAATSSDHDPGETAAVTAAAEMGIAARRPKLSVILSRYARDASSRRWPLLRARLRFVASLTPAEFTPFLNNFARRRLPIRPEQSAVRRAGVYLIRLALGVVARAARRGAVTAMLISRELANLASHRIVPDHDYAPFRPGDVLLSMANTWDYMDYRYLAKLGRDMGVRLICVIYDVVGMELPFVTPSPAHLYHRHWVEIGHVSECLIAISRFSAESYDRFIAQPNGIDVPVDHALLPNFLLERAAEIGETAVNELEGRNFVLYCSSIEVRKNHILLLHLWEELRQRVPPEKLPVLVFVGKWAWSAETVRLLIERNWRLRPHLRVMNETSDAELIWLYRHARFTVFPSLSEGFGLASSESLSFGTPVVISNCPALLEATERLMPAFHPHDFMAWLRELERLILDEEYLTTLREIATRFRGPAYDTFAAKVRDAALTRPATDKALAKENRP